MKRQKSGGVKIVVDDEKFSVDGWEIIFFFLSFISMRWTSVSHGLHISVSLNSSRRIGTVLFFRQI